MTQQIRVVIESLNDAGEVTGKEIIITKSVVKPNSIIDLGFRHSEQIDLLKHIQQQLLDKQSVFLREGLSSCPKCNGKLYKRGYIKSDFHAVFTDHKVAASRQICKLCKWASIPSIRSLFGNASHPDLVKVQCELGATHTFRDSQKIMNLLANTKRSTNNHDKIKRMTEAVGQHIAEHPDVIQSSDIKQVEHLYIQVDGGHVTTVEQDKRSFEVMTSVVFDAKNIEHTGGKVKKDGKISTLQGRLTSNHCAASALLDNRDNMKQQTLNAAIKQGMTLKTNMTAICDGAANCWDIVDSLEKQCNSLERILDWYHIAMKFQNTRLGQDDLNTRLSGAKWYLWHGLPDKAIERLRLIRDDLKKDKKQQTKVQLLLTYIENNSNYIVNYENKQNSGLIFTSQMAESTVESLINQRCKGKQHMRWSREGLHALLQIRASVNSNDWNVICESHINDSVYRKAA
jgi:hypothetical protein